MKERFIRVLLSESTINNVCMLYYMRELSYEEAAVFIANCIFRTVYVKGSDCHKQIYVVES